MSRAAKPEEVMRLIEEELGELADKVVLHVDYIRVEVRPERLKDVAKKLAKMGFDHVKSVTAIDHIREKRFEVLYHLSSYSRSELFGVVLELAYYLPRDNPVTTSLYEFWKSVDFLERETYEMFGIVFEGHPDLRPLLLDETLAREHPLRKDFVVREEGIFK